MKVLLLFLQLILLKNVIKSFLNSMTHDDEELINIITKVVMLPQVKNTYAAKMRLTSRNTQLLMMNASTRQKSIFLQLILCHILTCAFIRDTRNGLYEVHLSIPWRNVQELLRSC